MAEGRGNQRAGSIVAAVTVTAILLLSAALVPSPAGYAPAHRGRRSAFPEASPSVVSPQLVTDVGSTYAVSINANAPFVNASVFFGDGSSQYVQGGGGQNISASHVYKYPGAYLIWYVINYASGEFAGISDMIPVQVVDTQLNQNASLGMLAGTSSSYMSAPGENVSWYVYYNAVPDYNYDPGVQTPHQVYDQYLVVDRAGSGGNYAQFYSKNMAYAFNQSTGSYTNSPSNSYYNMSNLQAGFYMLKLTTDAAQVNQSTGTLSGAVQNTTGIWDFVVNSSSGTYAPTSGQIFNRVTNSSGNVTLDPQIAYFYTTEEILGNTMQQLVAMEGSSSTSYFPELASFLPSSGNGINNLSVNRTIEEYISGGWTQMNVTYAPSQVYTFTMRSNATWQDGSRVTSWDMAFGLIRDLLFVSGSTPGWMLAQVMLPGNTFQSNTFQNITNNITWSNASDTLTLYLQHPVQPDYIFGLLSSPGTFATDASWAYAHGAGLDFSAGGFTNYTREWQPGNMNPYLFTHIMSDGPYVMVYNVPGNMIYLKSNPGYNPPAAFDGREWAPAASVGNVLIQYTTSSYAPVLELASGAVQSVAQQLNSQSSWNQTQTLVNENSVTVSTYQSMSLFWFNFNALVNISILHTMDPNGSLPAVLFDSLAVRQVFAYSFQYSQYVNKLVTPPIRNTTFANKYAGMLPQGMIYNQSISDLNNTTNGVPYYNLTLAGQLWSGFVNSSMGSAMGISYNSAAASDLYNGKPLNIPIFIFSGDAPTLQASLAWGKSLQSIIPGLQYSVLPLQFIKIINFQVQGRNPMPIYELGWAPDYAYPTDYLGPMALPSNSTTYPGPNDMTPYWFNGNTTNPLIGQNQMVRQAANLTAMVNDYQNATASDQAHAQKWFQAMNEMLINMTFYVYLFQQHLAQILSDRINGSTVRAYNENAVYGAAGDLLFNTLDYNSYAVRFNQTGLPSGSSWFVNITNGASYGPVTGTSYTIQLMNGSYSYTISTSNFSYAPPKPGAFTISGAGASIHLTFSGKPVYAVVFTETGLAAGVEWYVNISGTGSSGAMASTTTTYTASLFNGTYTFTVASTDKVYRPYYTGTVTVSGGGRTVAVTFRTVTYPVAFEETGLASGMHWSVTVGSSTLSSANSTVTFDEVNGSYTYKVGSIQNYSATLNGGFTVAGSSVSIPVAFSKNATVHINITTPGATLTVDGVATAYSPGGTVLSIRQGYHFINVSKSGYQTFTDLFYFASSSYYVNVSLIPLTSFGYLAGTVFPADAYVSASGISISVTGGNFNQSLSPGSYYVTVEAQGYASASYLVNITNGHTTRLAVTLTRVNTSYSVSGSVNPHNASVMFGSYSAYVNSTGYYTISLPGGNYNYSVADNGYFPATGSLDLTANLILNFNLTAEPPAQSVVVTSSIRASGYNLTITNLTNGNGNISVTFSALVNGTLVVQIPYSKISNATISDVLNSKVYVNGTSYSNFSVALSSINGTFSVILTVYGLAGDPVMEWAYLPGIPVSVPPPPAQKSKPAPFTIPWYAYLAIGDAGVIVAAFAVRRVVQTRKK